MSAPPPPPPAEPSPAAAHVAPRDATSSGGASHPNVWIGWTVTGVLAAGAVVTGVLALGAKQDADTKLAALPGNANDISNAHKSTQLFAGLTDGLAGAAIVAGVVSLYFTLSGRSDASRSAGGATHPVAKSPSLGFGVGRDRVLLQGEF